MWARFLIESDVYDKAGVGCLKVENVDNITKIVIDETGTKIYFNNNTNELVRMMHTPLQITIRKD